MFVLCINKLCFVGRAHCNASIARLVFRASMDNAELQDDRHRASSPQMQGLRLSSSSSCHPPSNRLTTSAADSIRQSRLASTPTIARRWLPAHRRTKDAHESQLEDPGRLPAWCNVTPCCGEALVPQNPAISSHAPSRRRTERHRTGLRPARREAPRFRASGQISTSITVPAGESSGRPAVGFSKHVFPGSTWRMSAPGSLRAELHAGGLLCWDPHYPAPSHQDLPCTRVMFLRGLC